MKHEGHTMSKPTTSNGQHLSWKGHVVCLTDTSSSTPHTSDYIYILKRKVGMDHHNLIGVRFDTKGWLVFPAQVLSVTWRRLRRVAFMLHDVYCFFYDAKLLITLNNYSLLFSLFLTTSEVNLFFPYKSKDVIKGIEHA